MGITGPQTGQLIAEGVPAHSPAPTLSEPVMEAAEAFFGLSTHLVSPKRTRG